MKSTIHFSCDHCGQSIEAPKEYRGIVLGRVRAKRSILKMRGDAMKPVKGTSNLPKRENTQAIAPQIARTTPPLRCAFLYISLPYSPESLPLFPAKKKPPTSYSHRLLKPPSISNNQNFGHLASPLPPLLTAPPQRLVRLTKRYNKLRRMARSLFQQAWE